MRVICSSEIRSSQHLDDLLRGGLTGRAGTGLIAEDLLDGPAQRGGALGALDPDEAIPGGGPAEAPEADLAPRQSDFRGDLGVTPLVEGREDDGRSLPTMYGFDRSSGPTPLRSPVGSRH
jgi:hypothetical protein